MTATEQYEAVLTGAGLVEPNDRGVLLLTGDDRASYLQGLLSNDILALRPGSGCYATYLTPQGRMITDLIVLELGDWLLLDLPIGTKAGVFAKLDQFIFSEDVQVRDATADLSLLELHGPEAARLLATALEGTERDDLAGLGEHENRRLDVGEHRVIIAATRDLGMTGLRVYAAHDEVTVLRDALADAGAVPVEAAVANILRVEAGRPAFGVDMDESTIPLEAGIEDRAISMTKGCYVGQEVIVRVLHRGQGRVARRLVGMTLTESSNPPASPGDVVRESDGQPVGNLTSVVRSPRFGAIALGYVRRELAEPGTTVEVRHDDRAIAAVVSPLPFGGVARPEAGL